MNLPRIVLSTGLLLLCTSLVGAESSPKQPLNNADISKILVAGGCVSTIVQVIPKWPNAVFTLPDTLIPQDVNEKRTRTPAQQKIDSQLLMAARLKRQGLPTIEADLVYDSSGRAAVDISSEVTDNLLATIRREAGEVVNSYPQFKAVRAYLTLESLETIAGLREVRVISRAAQAELSSPKSTNEAARQSQQKPDRVRQFRPRTGKPSRKPSRRNKLDWV